MQAEQLHKDEILGTIEKHQAICGIVRVRKVLFKEKDAWKSSLIGVGILSKGDAFSEKVFSFLGIQL